MLAPACASAVSPLPLFSRLLVPTLPVITVYWIFSRTVLSTCRSAQAVLRPSYKDARGADLALPQYPLREGENAKIFRIKNIFGRDTLSCGRRRATVLPAPRCRIILFLSIAFLSSTLHRLPYCAKLVILCILASCGVLPSFPRLPWAFDPAWSGLSALAAASIRGISSWLPTTRTVAGFLHGFSPLAQHNSGEGLVLPEGPRSLRWLEFWRPWG